MNSTSKSLLQNVLRSDDSSWYRLSSLYRPMILAWLRHLVGRQDSEDLSQEVLTKVHQKLPRFAHNGRKGAFRAWLRTITLNRAREFWRANRCRPVAPGGSDFVEMLEQLEDPISPLSRLWDEEHDKYVLPRLLALVEPDFDSQTLRAFHQLTFDRLTGHAVAAALGRSEAWVFKAKSRVLSRLREVAAGLID